ncbi:MAG: type II toxin-antitoxin system VapC family toxin [Alphaproteobacteria bacterium]|nr:type II toxin-antitoxin system VapC family toxin [Alphaproteobacteria bacterium]
MSFLLDTNVVSEWAKPRPNPGVITWLANADEDRVFLSAVTLVELRYGVERLQTGARRHRLDRWLTHELLLRFEGRVLPIDEPVADACGKLLALRERAGRPMNAMDAMIAATAEIRGLALVTRNVADFDASVRSILNPWSGRD